MEPRLREREAHVGHLSSPYMDITTSPRRNGRQDGGHDTHDELMPHRGVGKQPPLPCHRHGRHSATMTSTVPPPYTMPWCKEQAHDNHARTC
jgi:hypothetical protein